MRQWHSADLNNGNYQNPIIFGNFADPSIFREGENYFMVHGGEAYRSMLMWHSRDLVNWEPLYYVLEGYEGKVRGPELVKHEDTYYIYNYGPGGQGKDKNWVVTTKDIHNGPWTEPTPIIGLEGIDPGHIIGEDGKRYLFMSKNVVYPLSEDGMRIIGEGRKVCEDWPIPDEWDIEGVCTESPKLFWKDGWCYLTVAEGGTLGPPTSHCTISFRARSIFGPWEVSPYNPISHTESRKETWWSKGHGTLVDTPEGEWYIVYHGIMNGYRHLGRMTLMEPVEWTEDGWFRIPESVRSEQPIAKPKASNAINAALLLSDDFQSGRLGLQWNCETKETYERISFNQNGLVMQAQGSSLHDTEALLCLNQHIAQEVMAEITVESGAAGGLTFCYSPVHSCGIALQDGIISTYNMGKDWIRNVHNLVEYRHNHIYLKLKNDHGTVSPWFSEDGENWTKINLCFDVTGWHRNSVKGFGWNRPGLVAFGQGQVTFRQFTYNGN